MASQVITNIIASQSVVGATRFELATALTLQSGTMAYGLSAKITASGARAVDSPTALFRMYFDTSPYNLSGANGAALLVRDCNKLERHFGDIQSGTPVVFRTKIHPVRGPYLYVWFELPKLSSGCLLDVNSIELSL